MGFRIIKLITLMSLIFNGTIFGVLETDLKNLNGNLTILNKSLPLKEERTVTLTFPFTDSIADYVTLNAPTTVNINPLSDAVVDLFEHALLRLDLASFEVPPSVNLDNFRDLLKQQKNFAPHFIKIKDIKPQGNNIIADIEYLDFNKNPLTKDKVVSSLENNNNLKSYFKSTQQPMDFLPTTVILKTFNDAAQANDYLSTIDVSLKTLLTGKPIIEIKNFSFIASDDTGTTSYLITL